MVKVKEPQPSEFDFMHPGLVLFTYLHLAAEKELTLEMVTRKMIQTMQPGSVVVDVSVDQGGCVETTRPSTHSDPTYVVDGVIHYGVTNMPGAVPRTSTYALSNVTLPYVMKIVRQGLPDAARHDPALQKGINTHQGRITYRAVAEAHGLAYDALEAMA